MKERWLPILGYEGIYEVSDLGRVRSLDRKVRRPNGQVHHLRGKIRIPSDNGHGYPALTLNRDGVKTCFKIHVLVARAFLGPRPPGKEVAHWDGDRANPKLKNLRYATPIENQADRDRHGTRLFGEKHGSAKLMASDVIAIRSRLNAGERSCDLAEEFGVVRSNIAEIKARRTWGHL